MKLKELYSAAGISKQAMAKFRSRTTFQQGISTVVVKLIKEKREHHKRMGCRTIYHTVKEKVNVGRDIFEQIGHANGYKLKRKRSVMKTTWSQRIEVYPNRIEGLVVNGINQVWQSDIFYLCVEGKNYYGVTIEDVYSRRLLAVHISRSLRAEENLKALKKAIKARAGLTLKGCIFHSDRGSQYTCDSQKQLLKDYQMVPSMCILAQQNAYVERVQGTLKNDYFYEHPLTETNVQQLASKIKKWYNEEKPHSNLKNFTPDAFENYIKTLVKNQLPELRIHNGYAALSTNNQVINKEKRSKKEKSTTKNSTLDS